MRRWPTSRAEHTARSRTASWHDRRSARRSQPTDQSSRCHSRPPAAAPAPGSHASSYADATGAGANYVYLVDAADDRGNVRELQLIFFGRESDGEGWLEIEARGGSGVRYRACDAAEAPAAARRALDR